MKKLRLLIIGLLLLLPNVAFAEGEPNVDTVTATISGSTITYSGTTVNDSVAVMCKLYNSNGEELKKFSSAVSDDKFEGEFAVTENGEFEVMAGLTVGLFFNVKVIVNVLIVTPLATETVTEPPSAFFVP